MVDEPDEVREVQECYRAIGDDSESFDIAFWQRQGDVAIFRAAEEMVRDYLMLRHGDAYESRLDRTVESFQKV